MKNFFPMIRGNKKGSFILDKPKKFNFVPQAVKSGTQTAVDKTLSRSLEVAKQQQQNFKTHQDVQKQLNERARVAYQAKQEKQFIKSYRPQPNLYRQTQQFANQFNEPQSIVYANERQKASIYGRDFISRPLTPQEKIYGQANSVLRRGSPDSRSFKGKI